MSGFGFKDAINGALDDLYNADFGDQVTYDGAPMIGFIEYVPEVGAKGSRYAARLQVRRTDVPVPAYRVPVTVNGESWLTGEPEDCTGDEFEWKIPLYRDERPRIK